MNEHASFAKWVERYEARLDDNERARLDVWREHFRQEVERQRREIDGDDDLPVPA